MKIYLSDDQRKILVESLYTYSNKLKSCWKDDAKEFQKDQWLREQQEIRVLISLVELKD